MQPYSGYPSADFNLNIEELPNDRSLLHQIKEEFEAEISHKSSMLKKGHRSIRHDIETVSKAKTMKSLLYEGPQHSDNSGIDD